MVLAAVPKSSSLKQHVQYSNNVQQYVQRFSPGVSRYRAVGRIKLLATASLAHAGYAPFVIEPDVVVFPHTTPLVDRLLMQLDGTSSSDYDLATMFCPETHFWGKNPLNRINLGFQRYNPAKSSTWAPFLKNVTRWSFEYKNWDQAQFNRLQICRSMSLCDGPALKLLKLTICEENPQYANEDGIAPFVEAVHKVGDVKAVGQSMIALHIIGNHGLTKRNWLKCGLVYEEKVADANPLYIMLLTPKLLSGGESASRMTQLLLSFANQTGRVPIQPPLRCGKKTCSYREICSNQSLPVAVLNGYLYPTSGGLESGLVVRARDLAAHANSSSRLLLVHVAQCVELERSLGLQMDEEGLVKSPQEITLSPDVRKHLVHPPDVLRREWPRNNSGVGPRPGNRAVKGLW